MEVSEACKLILGTYNMNEPHILQQMLEYSRLCQLSMVDTAQLYRNEREIFDFSHRYTDCPLVGTKIHRNLLPGATLHHVETLVQERNDGCPLARVLLHNPLPLHMWRDLEQAFRLGLVQQIGICNVNLYTLQKLCSVAEIKPHVIQVEFHPFLLALDSTLALYEYTCQQGIQFEAHSLLGGSRPVMRGSKETPLVTLSNALKVSTAEVATQLVYWVRDKAPAASLCIKASSREHLDGLLQAVKEPVSSISLGQIDFEQHLTQFRIYPIDNKNLLTNSMDVLFHWTKFNNDVMASFLDPSEDFIQNVVDFVNRDYDLLQSNQADANQFSGIAFNLHGNKSKGDVYLFTRVALAIFSAADEYNVNDIPKEKNGAFQLWCTNLVVASATSKLKSRLKLIRKSAQLLTLTKKALKAEKIQAQNYGAESIVHPKAMPVDVSDGFLLEPFFNWLSSLTTRPITDVQFQLGALLSGGHLDMCKQVVGPVHMSKLCQAVQTAAARGIVEHFLLGNNIAFEQIDSITGAGATQATTSSREEGISSMLELMRPKYGIKTWYLAGNCIDSEIVEKICAVLEENNVCKSLWLKRNPLGAEAGKSIGRLIALNKHIEVMDLHNTGLGDAGVKNLNDADAQYSSSTSLLNYIHLGANGITSAAASDLAALFARHLDVMESIYLDINRLGDDGMVPIFEVLSRSKVLKRICVGSNCLTDAGLETVVGAALTIPSLILLDVGFYKSTLHLGEKFNTFTSASPLIKLIQEHRGIQTILVENTSLPVEQCTLLQDAARARENIFLSARQMNFHGKGERVFPKNSHTWETIQSHRHPKLVDDIYSIYRNNM